MPPPLPRGQPRCLSPDQAAAFRLTTASPRAPLEDTARLGMRVEAVVADLDGTLVGADFSVSAATLDALDLLGAAGIPVVVATARTPAGLEYLEHIAARTEMAACCSGSIGWSPRHKELLWRDLLEPDVVEAVVALAVDAGAGVASFDGDLWSMTSEYERLSPGLPHGPTRVVVDQADLARLACCTMAVRHSPEGLAGVASALLQATAGTALSHVGRSRILDVTPRGIDKGTGTCRALAHLGIAPANAIGFGDMPNDLPLFAAVGRAYAVGNGDPSAISAADEVVPSVASDGFAKAINELAAAGWCTKRRRHGP